jgi:hypothetical protein
MTAAADWLTSQRYGDVAMVLLIEGTTLAFTSHPDHASITTAWATATQGRWLTVLPGLAVIGEISAEHRIFNSQVTPSSLGLSILDSTGALLPMFADADTTIEELRLQASIDCDDSNIFVVGNSTAAFSESTPTLHIGTEMIGATKAESTTGYGGTVQWFEAQRHRRGLNALFGNSQDGNMAQAHRIDQQTQDRPRITNRPVHWVNRGVGLYLCHRVNGVWSAGLPGTSTNDAQLIWAGRIKAFSDEGDGTVSLDCIDVLDRLKTTLGQEPFRGTLAEGIPITTGLQQYSTGVGTLTDTGAYTEYDTTTIATWSADAGEFLSASEAASAINTALAGRFITAAGTYGPSGMTLAIVRNSEGRYALRVTWLTKPATTTATVRLELDTRVWSMLGLPPLAGYMVMRPSGVAGSTLGRVEIGLSLGQEENTYALPQPPRRFADYGTDNGAGNEASTYVLRVDNVANGTAFVKQSTILANAFPPSSFFGGPSDTHGYLKVGKRFFAVKLLTQAEFAAEFGDGVLWTSSTFAFLGDVTSKFTDDASHVLEGIRSAFDDASSDAIEARQVWIEQGPVGELVMKILASTGTSGYNHPTYDVYPEWLAVGIPWSLLERSDFYGGQWPVGVLLVEKPMSFLTLLESALNFSGCHLVFYNGKIRVVQFGAHGTGETPAALTEANKASAIQIKQANAQAANVRNPIPARTRCDRNPEGIINRATLRYSRDPIEGGEFRKGITINAVSAQSDTAGEVKAITVESYWAYDGFDLFPGGSAVVWEQHVAANALAYFSKPIAVAERSYDFSLLTQLYPGARVTITDNHLIDPSTGTRGCSGLLGWVISTSFDFRTGVGRVRVVFQPSRATARVGVWGPSAMVDRGYDGAGAGSGSAGFAVEADTVLLWKFNEATVPGTGYATAADSASGARTLTESGQASTFSANYTHIVNGPGGAGTFARHFAGTGSTAKLTRTGDAASTALFVGTSSYTIEIWIRPTQQSGNIMAYVGVGAGLAEDWLMQLYVDTTGFINMYWDAGGSSATSAGIITWDTWQHWAITVDNSAATATVRFYINGTIKSTVTGKTKAAGGANSDWHFGKDTGGNPCFLGALCDVRVSNIARSSAEIQVSAASTTYQHTLDGNTFALWRFQEQPDALEESDYGYHARLVSGAIVVADPLVNDGGHARLMSSTTEYDCHVGYEPLRAAFADSCTIEFWIKMTAGYESTQRGIFNYGDPGPESLASNFFALDINTGGTVFQLYQEYSGGTNQIDTATLYPSVASALERHYVAVVKTPAGWSLYLDAVLVGSAVTANDFAGGTSSWLRISTGANSTANPLNGTLDDLRFSNTAHTQDQINTTYQGVFDCGYNAANKSLRLLPHAYSPVTDDADVTRFTVGDKVHIVQLSPSTPTGALEWSDTIAAIDEGNHMVTLTTGLTGFVCGSDYVLEFDTISTVVATQRTGYDYHADEDDNSTGFAANDAYRWTGDPAETPDETWIYTQRYRKANTEADDVGTAFSVHKYNDISRWAMNAAVYHTAPVLVNQPLTQAVTYGSGSTKRMVFGPVYVPLYYGTRRKLEVRLLCKSTAATCSFRAIVSMLLPRGDGAQDFDTSAFFDVRTDTQNWVTLTTSSTAYEWQTGTIDIPAGLSGFPGGGWFCVEASADGGGGTAGLLHVMLSEYVENAATIDVRQDTGFLPDPVVPPVLAVHSAASGGMFGGGLGAVRGRYAEAVYASTRVRQRGQT